MQTLFQRVGKTCVYLRYTSNMKTNMVCSPGKRLGLGAWQITGEVVTRCGSSHCRFCPSEHLPPPPIPCRPSSVPKLQHFFFCLGFPCRFWVSARKPLLMSVTCCSCSFRRLNLSKLEGGESWGNRRHQSWDLYSVISSVLFAFGLEMPLFFLPTSAPWAGSNASCCWRSPGTEAYTRFSPC